VQWLIMIIYILGPAYVMTFEQNPMLIFGIFNIITSVKFTYSSFITMTSVGWWGAARYFDIPPLCLTSPTTLYKTKVV